MGQKGQSLVEFALILFVLVIFVLGIIDFGVMIWITQALTGAAGEGARAGAVQAAGTPLDYAAIESAVKRSSSLNPSRLEVDLSESNDQDVIVRVKYHYQLVSCTPLGFGPIELQGYCLMRRE